MVQKSVAQALEYYPPEKNICRSPYCKNTHAFPQGSCQFTALPGKPGGTAGSKEPYRIRRILFFLLVLRKNKDLAAKTENHFPMYETADTVRFLEQLPFPLTKAQKKSGVSSGRIWEVLMP